MPLQSGGAAARLRAGGGGGDAGALLLWRVQPALMQAHMGGCEGPSMQ